jgi:hypothetical protein
MMQAQGIKYGFNIALKELMETVPTLGKVTEEFMDLQNIKGSSVMALMKERPCGMFKSD